MIKIHLKKKLISMKGQFNIFIIFFYYYHIDDRQYDI